jgi:hypothetical protein
LVPGSSEAGYLFLSTEDFNTFAFGLSKVNSSPDGTTAAVYQKNVTYLLVMKYEVISGSGNDRVSLYVFSGTIPATEPVTPDLGPFSLGPDLSGQTPRVIVLRQDNLNQDITIDGIRLGTSWEVSPLPVELSSFTAVLNNNKVILNWQTETEVNNYGFEVLKSESKNQQTEWQTIGFVEGYGNSNSPKSYSYTDNLTQNSAQTLRYRLKQIDNDGQYSYSKEIEVSTHERMRYELDQNYPNPFNPVTKITFTMPETGEVKLTVYNVVGEKVKELINGKLEKGRHSVEFDGRELSSGMYIYRLETGRFSDQKKMILIK